MLQIKDLPSLSHYNRESSAINMTQPNVKTSSISTAKNYNEFEKFEKQAALLITEISQVSPNNQPDKRDSNPIASNRAKAELLKQTEKDDKFFDE